MPISLLSDLEANVNDLGVLSGENPDMRPLLGPSDDVLVDLKDHKLVKDGLFIAQVQDRLVRGASPSLNCCHCSSEAAPISTVIHDEKTHTAARSLRRVGERA